ncbi:MAG: ATP-binding cassette domain-containing protein [Planctomycetes bacterium]|nr:ATP-binding cassette domain-containing protein [Planctomycetota bacterium]
MSDPIVRLDTVGRSYTKGVVPVAALRSVSFSITPGEYVSIMGPSGSGKSTMLNLLARERHRRAAEWIEMVGLSERRNHRPTQLSGGEMQRVAIARSLVNDPLLILADEPTGNLDTGTAEVIAGLLDDLHARGRTIVMVTHNPDLARRTSRILRLRHGELQKEAVA